MFKAMPKSFWIGMLILYGYSYVLIGWEWITPGIQLTKFLGIPACWIYNMFIGVFALNSIVAWYFAHSEEQREAKLEKK
ncbi:MAG: hypothetical protein V1766_05740 [Pseudomonadota bacterium]